jgi:hypothetical protein
VLQCSQNRGSPSSSMHEQNPSCRSWHTTWSSLSFGTVLWSWGSHIEQHEQSRKTQKTVKSPAHLQDEHPKSCES